MHLVRSFFFVMVLLPSVIFASDKFLAKVAVVDVQSILEHSTAVAHIKKSINEISERIQADLSAKENELKNIEADLIKQRGVLSEEEFQNVVLEFNKKVSVVQQEMQNRKSALERAHSVALEKVHKNTVIVIGDLSKKYGFNVVLPSAQVLFVSNDLNITSEVISNLNERLQTVDVQYDMDISQ